MPPEHPRVSYITKRNKAVILLSTVDDTGEIDVVTNKPNIILDYNSTKGGVDSVDQKCASYTPRRRIYLTKLDFDLIEDHLTERTKLQAHPKDVTEFLS